MDQHPAVVAVLLTARRLERIHRLEARYTAKLVRQLEQLPAGPFVGRLDNLLGSKPSDPSVAFTTPIVDVTAMTVTWRGQPCPLGNTNQLALIDRIARNPNRWVPYDRLKWDLWGDESISDGAVKVTVARLRRQLSQHHMEGLAAMIHVRGLRCGFFPGGLPD